MHAALSVILSSDKEEPMKLRKMRIQK